MHAAIATALAYGSLRDDSRVNDPNPAPSTNTSDTDRAQPLQTVAPQPSEAVVLIGRYHEEQLRLLLQHVRGGFEKLDAGELDPFELDDLIHHYKRSAQMLWSFCNSGGSGTESAARTLEWNREHCEEEPDWWELGRPRRRSD